jgi:murein DD-endopeptidase MepM/ murein hydrolase activator NlpD
MSDRTFVVKQPHMEGADVLEWQKWLNDQARFWGVNYQIPEDGDYGIGTRDMTASIVHGLGLSSASEAMKDGVTPELRIKLRNKKLSPVELARYHGPRKLWRMAWKKKHEGGGSVHTPAAHILADSWGYHPPVHDGVDLITPPNEPLLAICDGTIVRVQAGGWWGKGAPSNPAVKAKGDGIIVLRCDIDAGPFKPGLLFGYGHAEGAVVKEGDKVKAGQKIGEAGLANAYHAHFMVHGPDTSPPVGGTGDRDPMPYVDFAKKNT